MPAAPQEPAIQNISFVRGDGWAIEVDFAESVVGKTFTGGLFSTVTGQLVQAIACEVLDAAAGRVNLSLAESATSGLVAGTYRFRLSWSPATRRIYQGFAEVLA